MPDTFPVTDVSVLIAERDRLKNIIIAYENTDNLGYQGLEELSAHRRQLDAVNAQIAEMSA